MTIGELCFGGNVQVFHDTNDFCVWRGLIVVSLGLVFAEKYKFSGCLERGKAARFVYSFQW